VGNVTRPTPELLAEIRTKYIGKWSNLLDEVIAELDAVTRERDEARKHAEERGTMLFDEQIARQAAERERDALLAGVRELRVEVQRLTEWVRR
jgi:uncharacterized coiled-coil DUF342 family protein